MKCTFENGSILPINNFWIGKVKLIHLKMLFIISDSETSQNQEDYYSTIVQAILAV